MTPTLTRHAATRLVDMGATPREVKLALTSPEHVRPHGTERDREYWRRGRLELVVDVTSATVITALWSTRKHWSHDDRTTRSRPTVR